MSMVFGRPMQWRHRKTTPKFACFCALPRAFFCLNPDESPGKLGLQPAILAARTHSRLSVRAESHAAHAFRPLAPVHFL